MVWGFYGRKQELRQLQIILHRRRWFFARLSGRRRIGKTTLIQQALQGHDLPVVYIQVPDSGPAGVLSAVRDAFETFQVDVRQNSVAHDPVESGHNDWFSGPRRVRGGHRQISILPPQGVVRIYISSAARS